MQKSVTIRAAALLLLAALISSCGGGRAAEPTADVGAIQTQAVALVSTQVALQATQTALVVPPTPLPSFTPLSGFTPGGVPTFIGITGTPLAGFTPVTGVTPIGTFTTANGCNDGAYVGETGPADKSVLQAGKEFAKAFTIQNTGTCTWGTGYTFDYLEAISSPQMPGKDIVYRADDNPTKPGHSNSFIVRLVAPAAAGEYKAYFKLKDAQGNYFGPQVYAWIIVE